MISRLLGAVFTPKHPKGYTGRHRVSVATVRDTASAPVATSSVIGRVATN